MSLGSVCARGPKRVRFSLPTASCPRSLTGLPLPPPCRALPVSNQAGDVCKSVSEHKTDSFCFVSQVYVFQHHLLEATLVAYGGTGRGKAAYADRNAETRDTQ